MNYSNSRYVKEKCIAKGFLTAMSYEEYRKLVRELVRDGKSTGLEQTETLANYTTKRQTYETLRQDCKNRYGYRF